MRKGFLFLSFIPYPISLKIKRGGTFRPKFGLQLNFKFNTEIKQSNLNIGEHLF